ncbi:MAG: hypothetical protein LBB12_01995 [Holosporaceae bacterium]|nr:hypothetical protein [Holosporaceae bacterium]
MQEQGGTDSCVIAQNRKVLAVHEDSSSRSDDVNCEKDLFCSDLYYEDLFHGRPMARAVPFGNKVTYALVCTAVNKYFARYPGYQIL